MLRARALSLPPKTHSAEDPPLSESRKSSAQAEPPPAAFDSTIRQTTPTTSHVPQHTSPIITMAGVSVKDVDAQKFITAYAAFLKRQGKLPMYVCPLSLEAANINAAY